MEINDINAHKLQTMDQYLFKPNYIIALRFEMYLKLKVKYNIKISYHGNQLWNTSDNFLPGYGGCLATKEKTYHSIFYFNF